MKIELSELKEWLNRPQTLAGAVKISRIVAILTGVLTVVSLLFLGVILWPVLANTGGLHLFSLLDELEDVIEGILLLAGGSAAFTLLHCFLKKKEGVPKL